MAELFLANSIFQGHTVSLFHDPSMGSSQQGQVSTYAFNPSGLMSAQS
jgi:hypothetical protein